jgi:hypothetical protein
MSLQKYLDLFESKTRKSGEIYEEARKLMPFPLHLDCLSCKELEIPKMEL